MSALFISVKNISLFAWLAVVFCLALVAPVDSSISFAQEIDYDEVPDEYITEARQVYQKCLTSHSRNMYYDCKCFSMSYLEERISRGPIAHNSSIESAISGKCRDATEAAGYEYQQCLGSFEGMQPGTDPEKLCECYANRFVEIFEYVAPPIQSRNIRPLKIQARLECSDPALARKLYGRVGIQ